MIVRVFVATLGALVVTAGLLLAMESFTSKFRERDGGRYFLITDVLVRPPPDRPERPAPVARPPEAPRAVIQLPSGRLRVEPPTGYDPAPRAPASVAKPELDLSGDSSGN